MSATNRGATRHEADFYATPLSAFEPLLPYLPGGVRIWEPAMGDARLVTAMIQYGLTAWGNDISIENNRPYDFLQDREQHEVILTNPPFSFAFEFARHASTHSKHTYLLLRLNFLASKKRKDWFVANEPKALFILTKRPCFTDDGKTDATDYAWFYWCHDINIKPLHNGIIHL